MPTRGATVVILNDDRSKVLLHKREDFRIWALPGGGLEPDEDFEAAAIRETKEETGYQVVVDHFAGEYWRPQWGRDGDWTKVFVGHAVGGEAIQRGDETLAVDWFPLNALPVHLAPFTKARLTDTLDNIQSRAKPFKKTIIIP
jgi:8-oxo-dGTP diphosphatase